MAAGALGPDEATHVLREDDPSCLMIVVDVNPAAWGQHSVLANEDEDSVISFSEFFNQLLFFIHSYLVLQQDNTLCVVAAHPNYSRIVYPEKSTSDDDVLSPRYDAVKAVLTREIPKIVSDVADVKLTDGPKLSAALTLALCYSGRVRQLRPNVSPRAMVVQISQDVPAQYISVMNAIFSAKKERITVDSLLFHKNDSTFLQQASSLTDGIYLKPAEQKGCLQYLLTVFLVDTYSRQSLVLPHQSSVDFRAACFCHKKVIDTGYVCSVCLSIFCGEVAICSTCNTKLIKVGVGNRRLVKKPKTTNT